MTNAAGLASTAATGFTSRNKIINGAMVIDQRNAGASSTTAGAYTVDRWKYAGSQASKFTWQQNAGSVTPPAGFSNYLGFTSSSAYTVLSTDYFQVFQKVEGFNAADLAWGTANAKAVTLSFYARSSLTGTFGGGITNNASDRSYPFSYSIPVANTWTFVTITIPGDTTGTWLTNNSGGLVIIFSLGTGSTFQGTAGAWAAGDKESVTGEVQVVGTNGATFYITGVQLEKGTAATPFEFRPYQQELALCQRYYYRTTYGANSTTLLVGSVNATNTAAQLGAPHPVTMRASPTASYASVTVYDGTTATAVTSIQAQSSSTTHATINIGAAAGGLTVGRAAVILSPSSAAYLDYSAEL